MPQPVPLIRRREIVNAYESGLGSLDDIAKKFNVSVSSLCRYLKKHRTTGDLTPVIPSGTGRKLILNEQNLEIIKNIVLSNTEMTMQNYRDIFYQQTGIQVTVVTIWNACKLLNIRQVKVCA